MNNVLTWEPDPSKSELVNARITYIPILGQVVSIEWLSEHGEMSIIPGRVCYSLR